MSLAVCLTQSIYYLHLGKQNVSYLKLANSKGLVLLWSFLISEDRKSPTRTPRISMRSCLLYVEHNLQRVLLSIVWWHLSNVSAVFKVGLPEEEYAHQCWPLILLKKLNILNQCKWVCNIGQEDAKHNNTINTNTSQYVYLSVECTLACGACCHRPSEERR